MQLELVLLRLALVVLLCAILLLRVGFSLLLGLRAFGLPLLRILHGTFLFLLPLPASLRDFLLRLCLVLCRLGLFLLSGGRFFLGLLLLQFLLRLCVLFVLRKGRGNRPNAHDRGNHGREYFPVGACNVHSHLPGPSTIDAPATR